MDTIVTPVFERLCDAEFAVAREAAYDGLEREVAQIKENHNVLGCYVSTSTGQTVKDAVLARFDRVVAAFDRAYLSKWRDNSVRPLTDGDVDWLKRKAGCQMDAVATEAESKCNIYLGEPRDFFAQYWCGTGIEARERCAKIQNQIEILKMQKDQEAQSTGQADLSFSAEDRRFAQMALEEARKSIGENDGRTHPKVGAVVVRDNLVLASAHRGEKAGCHAEYIALEQMLAGTSVAGATVYTTLEPCTERNHPKVPCAHRLVERKVKRVVIGTLDPNPAISGQGVFILWEANIITDLFPHDLMSQVEELNREFIRLHRGTTAAREQRSKAADDAIVSDHYFGEQIKRLSETDIVERIKEKPRWRLRVHPSKFTEAQFRDLGQVKHFVLHNAIKSRFWDYPRVNIGSIEEDSRAEYIAGELDSSQRAPGYLERWALFRSGQFFYTRTLQEFSPDNLHYLEVLRVVSHLFEFAKRMADASILSPEAVVNIQLENIAGLGLLVPESFEIGSSPSYWCKEKSMSIPSKISPEDLILRSRDLALDAVFKIYKGFGWIAAEKSHLAKEQECL